MNCNFKIYADYNFPFIVFTDIIIDWECLSLPLNFKLQEVKKAYLST